MTNNVPAGEGKLQYYVADGDNDLKISRPVDIEGVEN